MSAASTTTTMDLTERQNRLTTGFFIISILLHLLLLLIPERSLLPPAAEPEPVYVEVRPPQPRERELDLPVRSELEKPRETPAKRLGPADQVVEQEMAPEGQDTEDRQPSVKSTPTPPQPPAPPQPRVEQSPPKPDVTARVGEPLKRPTTPEGTLPRSNPAEKPTKPLPDLTQLTQISPGTLAQIESDWRRKYREDVQKGDTVWMDTEQDLLHSFMKRFRDNIYLVWNYPDAAARQGQQGTCLLRITVDRRGNVEEVRLLESSGYRILDEEAIRAVKQGATYGPLPRAYPNEVLNIMAFFQYSGSRVYRRPGDIY